MNGLVAHKFFPLRSRGVSLNFWTRSAPGEKSRTCYCVSRAQALVVAVAVVWWVGLMVGWCVGVAWLLVLFVG